MIDTMTLTKGAAGLCGALLVLLLAKWGADTIYNSEGESEEASYVIEVEDAVEQDEVAGVSFADMMAAADIAKGAKIFKKCSACHKLADGKNATGPFLYGVVDRPIGSAAGFGYTSAMSALGGDWSAERLDEFLTKPRDYVPGTSMGFSGLKKQDDRVNLIAYLDSLDG
jgi:cytochrome c